MFYYADKASYDAHNRNDDPIFAAAEAEREADWLNDELTFPWVYKGAITTIVK